MPPPTTIEELYVAIQESLDRQRFSVLDGFAGTPGTLLSDWTPLINSTKSKWTKRVGVNMTLVDDSGTPAVKMAADDFTALGTLYTIDAGCTSYILRARVRVTGAEYGRLYFRTDASNRGYSILWTQNAGSSWFRLSKFDGASTTTVLDLSGAAAPSLTSGTYYWLQVHVTGTRVRAFFEGHPYKAIVAEMDEFFNATFVGIGGPRSSTHWASMELEPLPMAVEFDALAARMTLLENSVDLLATSVPSAIAPVQVDLETLITERTLATADYVTDAELAARTLPTANYATMDALGDLDFSPLAAQLTDIQETLSDLGPVPQWLPPVAPSGQIIAPIIIGDDYLVANGRAFTWLVAAIAGVDPLTSTFRFGGQRIIRPENNWLVTGTVAVVDASTWRLTAELPKVYTESLAEGPYRFSGEVVSNTGVEITRIQSGSNLVQLVKKQT